MFLLVFPSLMKSANATYPMSEFPDVAMESTVSQEPFLHKLDLWMHL